MKTVLWILFVSLFLAPSIGAFSNPQYYYDWNEYGTARNRVLAAEDGATPSAAPNYREYEQHDYVLGFVANTTSDNPLYFLKKLEEGTALAFTFNPQIKERLRLEIAGERLQEMEELARVGKTEALTRTAQDYQQTINETVSNLNQFKSQGQNVTPLLLAVDAETAKHNLVLEEVALQAPMAAEAGLKTAMIASEKVADTVADLSGRPAVPTEVAQRLQSLKAQGILSEEEVSKIINVKSRQEARIEMRKYTEQRLVPESDFKKLDEAARSYFPEGYNTALEIKKFRELKDLETQKPDEQTLGKVQDFAKTYKAGEIVPTEIRRWWVPLVRLEELQNTFRPDLIKEDIFKYRPEDKQKYDEIVKRVQPRPEDMAYVNKLITANPALANDPAYARIKAMGDRFGASCPQGLEWRNGYCAKSGTEITSLPIPSDTGRACGQAITSAQGPNGECAAFTSTCIPDGWKRVGSCDNSVGEKRTESCGNNTHWVSVPYMPNGGYCVPNYNHPNPGDDSVSCPSGYHRNEAGGSCYPDKSTDRIGGDLPAIGNCGAGYRWVPEPDSPRRGYCSPDYPGIGGGGGYPNPITPPTYCPSGQMFRDGKCVTYNPAPTEGCPSNQWWNGSKCIERRDCEAGYHQDNDGGCKKNDTYWPYPQPNPTYGDSYITPSYNNPSIGSSPYPMPSSGSTYNNPSYNTPPVQDQKCGSGYYWNGSSCVTNSGGGSYTTPPAYQNPPTNNYQTPPTNYQTPPTNYQTPPSNYQTPPSTYQNPPSYNTPSYETPSYNTPTYNTPSYENPPAYQNPPTESAPPPVQGAETSRSWWELILRKLW